MSDTHIENLFIDSGAHTLYNTEVKKHGKNVVGSHGRVLAPPKVKRGQGDFSYFDLKPGTPFRRYCDNYASLMKAMTGRGILFTNVDVITNPEKTWEVQQYFEKEHGLQPVPVIHAGTAFKHIDRYIDGKHDLLGMGGLGQRFNAIDYMRWADQVYLHLCPKSNGYKPIIKTHGFAMTSWRLITRWPWWSVDSATWIRMSSYGWVLFPRWSIEKKKWRFDKPPLRLGVSRKETDVVSPVRQTRNQHIDNCVPYFAECLARWLEHIGVKFGKYGKDNKVREIGVTTDYTERAFANLTYMKNLEESVPPWPWPIDPRIIGGGSSYHRGFGL